MKSKNKPLVVGMIIAIITLMMTIVFSNSDNINPLLPIAGGIAGLIATKIIKRKEKLQQNDDAT